MNDQELLSAFVHGDEQALGRIIQKYLPMVYGTALRQLGDAHLAEDVAQSVFILLSRKAPGLSPNVLLGGWLLRTTRFVARDVKKQMVRRLEREEQATRLAVAAEQPAESALTLAPLVDEALASLPSKDQQTVLARFIEGRSFREIGQQHRISEDAAQKRISRSLEKMRLFLERRGIKTGAAAFSSLLAANLVQTHEPRLVETTINAVCTALHHQAGGSSSLALANAAADGLRRSFLLKLTTSSLSGLLLLSGVVGVAVDRWEPAVPAGAPFQVSDPRIESLATAWARVAARAAQLIRRSQPTPPPGDPNFASFQQELLAITQDGDAIHAQFLAAFPNGASPSQLAEFLTIELRETAKLSPKQQAAVFSQLKDELNQGVAGPQIARPLLRDKTLVGNRIRSWLSPHQRRQFDRTYGQDDLGLFTFMKLK